MKNLLINEIEGEKVVSSLIKKKTTKDLSGFFKIFKALRKIFLNNEIR